MPRHHLRSTLRTAGRVWIGALLAVAMVAALSVVTPMTAALAAPEPEPPLAVGEEFTFPYYAEPEFLLVSGQDRWNVRNRPDGTVAGAYGHAPDSIHDDYMASARYDALGSNRDRTPIDVAYVAADPDRSRTHAWSVARYDDHVEVWGPVDAADQQAYTLAVPGRTLVGGTVLADYPSSSVPGRFEPAQALAVDDAGLLVLLDYENSDTQVLGHVGAEFGADVGAVAAVARTWSDAGNPAVQSSWLFDGVRLHGATPFAELMVVLLDNGHLVPITITNAGAQILPSLSTLDAALVVDPTTFPADGPVLVDFDFTCTDLSNRNNFAGLSNIDEGNETGIVAGVLACPPGRFSDFSNESMSGGRLSVGIGVEHEDGIGVRVVTAADAAEISSGKFVLRTDHRNEMACGNSEAPAPGSFDVRTVFAVTHVACVNGLGGAGFLTNTYYQPSEYSFVNGPDGAAGREPVFGVQGEFVEHRTFDRLAQPLPGESYAGPPIRTDAYENVRDVTVALQFPCESLLPRPLGQADGTLSQCGGISAGQPANWVSITTAGYGDVDGERRAFLNNQPHEGLLRNALEARDIPFSLEEADRYSWTTEPAEYRARDLQQLRESPETADPDTFDVFDADGAPPLFLTHIPNGRFTNVTFEILDATPTTETTPGKPVAVLQAPPTVAGLGQQTTFTPEFADTTSTGNSATNSTSTRMGTHFGVEATVVVGAGFAGTNGRAGGGAAFDFGFMSEVEKSIEDAVVVERTESYGGSFADHTIVTESIVQDVWRARVTEDASGLAVGDEFDFSIPKGNVRQSVLLGDLAAQFPAQYGPDGLFRASLDRILVGDIGDPGSYLLTSGEDGDEPPSLLLANGGPCKGGFAFDTEPTPFTGDLPNSVPPENPYVSSDPKNPTGPSVLLSRAHLASVGNDLTEGASIAITETTARSLVTSESYDFALTGIYKMSAESDAGVSTQAELTITAGVDAGFSDGAAISTELGEGSSMTSVMGNIPHVPPTDDHWLNGENYSWRMFMCKAPFGPAGLSTDIWVQGYLVDEGYSGSGGLEDMAPVSTVSPRNSEVVLADPGGADASVQTCIGDPGLTRNRFQWDQESGSLSREGLLIENVSSGGLADEELTAYESPQQFALADRRDCADLAAASFVDGDLYRWRPQVNGFLGDHEEGDWHFFRPQVWPPSQDLGLRTPIVNSDHSVTVDIDDPPGVTSLLHDVAIFEIDGETRTPVVERGSITNGRYRTPALEPGLYEAAVVGHNSHRLEGGDRAETPVVTAEFRIEEQITSQFSYEGCTADPCTTAETVEFRDESLPADGIPITGWSWYFGDGVTSTEQHPSHRFTELPDDGSGAYDVFLTTTDAIGRTDTVAQQVLVRSAPPEFDVTGLETDIGIDQPLTMDISATDPDNEGRDPDAWQIPIIEWDLDDDDSPDVTETGFDSSATHTFGAAGDHPVVVTATDPFGESTTYEFTVTVHDAPTAGFTDTACEAPVTCTPTGTEIDFDPSASSSTAGDIEAWEWNFGDGTTVEIDDPADRAVAHAFDRSGEYTVALRVQDRFGQWSSPLERVVVISNRQATATITSNRGFDVDTGVPVTFSAIVADPDGDPASATVSWVFEPGDPAVGGSPATHTWNTVGDKTVSVSVTDDSNETSTQQFTVRVTEPAPPPPLGPCTSANPEAGNYVRSALTDLVGSAPASRVEALCPQAVDSAGRAALARQLAFSADYLRGVVDRGYRTVLRREAEAAGSRYWVGLLASGDLTTADFIANLYSSEEYFARAGRNVETWVANLYRDLLHRSPDAGGAAYWADTTRRIGRTAVAGHMHQSLESRITRVRDAYRRFLDRAADGGGERYWADVIGQNGGDDVILVVYLVTSVEYFSRSQRRWR